MFRLILIFTLLSVGLVYSFYSFSEYKSSLLLLSRSFLQSPQPNHQLETLLRLVTNEESWPAFDLRQETFLDYSILGGGGVPRMLNKRQTACPTGTSACGTDGACCQEDENCWIVTSTCAKKGTCPGTHPVLCHNQTADPQGQDASKFYCCSSGLLCLNDLCEEPKPTESPEPFTITINRISFANGATPTPSNSDSVDTEATTTSTSTSTAAAAGAGAKDDVVKGRNQTTAIVGGVLGGAIVLFAIVGVLLFRRSRRKGRKVPYVPPSSSNGTTGTYTAQKAELPAGQSHPHSPAAYPSYSTGGGGYGVQGGGGRGGSLET